MKKKFFFWLAIVPLVSGCLPDVRGTETKVLAAIEECKAQFNQNFCILTQYNESTLLFTCAGNLTFICVTDLENPDLFVCSGDLSLATLKPNDLPGQGNQDDEEPPDETEPPNDEEPGEEQPPNAC